MILFFCLFFQLFSVAHAEVDWHNYLPKRDTPIKFKHWILDHSPRKVRIFLHANIPSLFPVNNICQLHDGPDINAFLPGDTFQIDSDRAELNCKNLLKLTLLKGSSGTVTDEGDEANIKLSSGGAELVPLGKRVRIHFPGSDFRITDSDPLARFAIRKDGQDTLIFCNRGLVEGILIAPPGEYAQWNYLGTSNCRLILSDGRSNKKNYVFSRGITLFRPSDINSPKKLEEAKYQLKEKFPDKDIISNQENFTWLSLQPATDPSAILQLHVHRTRPVPSNCTLSTQTAADAPLVSAYQFKLGADVKSVVKLHPDYKKYFLSVICTHSVGRSVSNRVSPQ